MIKHADGKFYKELRCYHCRRLLALEYIFKGRLMIKCPHCNFLNTINYKTPVSLIKKIEEAQASGKLPADELVLKDDTNLASKGGE